MSIDIVENFHAHSDEPEVEEVEVVEVQYEPFTPINDRVMLKRFVEDNTKKGSFIIPELYRQQSKKGTVIAVGEKVTVLQAGDVVLFGDYSSEHFDKDGEDFLIVSIHDIRGFERPKVSVTS